MLLRALVGSVCLLAIVASAALSCSSDDASHANPEAGAPLDAMASDGGDDSSADVVVASSQAMVRFAHLSPDAPAIDVCVAMHGTGVFKGPLLAPLATAVPADASAPGLSFTEVSAYVALDPGTYDLRLVPAGSTSCTPGAMAVTDAGSNAGEGPDATADAEMDASVDAADASDDAEALDASRDVDATAVDAAPGPVLPLPPDTTNLPAFVAGGFTTVLLAGELAPAGADAPYRAVALRDDTVLAGGGATLRAINALPAVPDADFGFGSEDASWSPLFADVAFGGASLTAAPYQGKADANGYLVIAPLGPGTFSARTSGDAASQIASSDGVTVSLGTVATILAAGGKTGDPRPPVLVLCSDNAPPGGARSVCNVLP